MSQTVVSTLPANRRILLVDDNASIHEDFRKILTPVELSSSGVDSEAAALFDQSTSTPLQPSFEIDSAYQGVEALELVKSAKAAGKPYSVAFVDMRMPPGWDGLTTISKLWEQDPDIQTVICTAYSDRSWEEIQSTLSARERWLVLKKPFDKIEVLQLAHGLAQKWNLSRLASLKMDTLERMVEARTVELINAQRIKNEFLANTSHELLTPMNGICGFLDLLAHSSLNEQQKADIDQAKECASNLLRLIKQVLDFNRLEAGTLEPEIISFCPAEMIRSIASEYETVALAKGLQLKTVASDTTRERWAAPENLIRKALHPLMSNALKFTTKGAVTLGVEPCSEGLRFYVEDTGIGLTLQQLDWIKLPFAQVDGGMNRRGSGIGLGLPLARGLAHALGGEFLLDGKPNQGACAQLRVKARPASAQAPLSSAA